VETYPWLIFHGIRNTVKPHYVELGKLEIPLNLKSIVGPGQTPWLLIGISPGCFEILTYSYIELHEWFSGFKCCSCGCGVLSQTRRMADLAVRYNDVLLYDVEVIWAVWNLRKSNIIMCSLQRAYQQNVLRTSLVLSAYITLLLHRCKSCISLAYTDIYLVVHCVQISGWHWRRLCSSLPVHSQRTVLLHVQRSHGEPLTSLPALHPSASMSWEQITWSIDELRILHVD